MRFEIGSAGLKSSSIVETIVAVLILLISFALGMMIYNNVMQSTYADIKSRANLEQGMVADSLIQAGHFEKELFKRNDLSYEVNYKAQVGYPELLVMELQCFDGSGQRLSGISKLIRRRDEE